MANPVTKIRNTAADYRKLDGRDKRRFWTDGILNNALYILMAIFIIHINRHNCTVTPVKLQISFLSD